MAKTELAPINLCRLTTTQRDALSGTADGDAIYNTTVKRMQVRQNSAWQNFSPEDGWILDINTWTRTGNLTFTLAVDATTWLPPGTKIKVTDSGSTIRYGVVGTVVFSSGTTTVTLITNDDHPLASGAMTLPCYSYAASPPGFPSAFAWTPTLSGWSSNPTTTAYRWSTQGRICTIWITQGGNGTSNATSHTATLPVSIVTGTSSAVFRAVDNNTTQAGVALISTLVPATVSLAGILASSNTASGNSRVIGAQMSYEF